MSRKRPQSPPDAAHRAVDSVEPAHASARPKLADFLRAYNARGRFEIAAVPPYCGHYVGNGLRVGAEPRSFPVAQLFELDPSYLQALLSDDRVMIRVLEC